MNGPLTPSILPLFRSEVQFRILGELFTHPELEVAVGELAERVGHPRPTVSHEVRRLVEAGLLHRRRQGNRSLIRAATDTSVSDDLRSLLTKTYGPVAQLREAFSGLDVTYVAVFGSYAARWHGEPGPPPNDIDVLLVGDLDYETVWDITARLSRQLGIEVNAVLRDNGAWDEDDTPFSHAIKQGHVIDIVGEATTGQRR